jgi:hypothetical protein
MILYLNGKEFSKRASRRNSECSVCSLLFNYESFESNMNSNNLLLNRSSDSGRPKSNLCPHTYSQQAQS